MREWAVVGGAGQGPQPGPQLHAPVHLSTVFFPFLCLWNIPHDPAGPCPVLPDPCPIHACVHTHTHAYACIHTCSHRGMWVHTHTHTHVCVFTLHLSPTILPRARCHGLTCVQGQALPHHTSHTVKNVLGSNHTIPSALGDSPQLLSPQGLLTGGPGGPGWPASPFGPVGPWGERKENQPWSLRSDGTCPPGGRERSPGAHGEGRGVDRTCWAPPSRRCENRTPEGEPGGQGPSLGAGSRGLR